MQKTIKGIIKKGSEVTYEYLAKNKKGIETRVYDKAPKGHYKNDLIRLICHSENKSGNIDVLMTPYEAFIIIHALQNALMFHKKTNKNFLK